MAVRVTPVLGEKVWFAPRRMGWGLSPVSLEGWVATVVVIAVGFIMKRRPDLPRWMSGAVMVPFIVLVALKGTSPGGPRARSQFESSRGEAA
jgi:hypothetical protein